MKITDFDRDGYGPLSYPVDTNNYDSKIFERWPLRVRGCLWAAQISSRNRQIEIPEMMGSDSSQTYVDYLGPDVDTGFRLAGCRSVRR